MAKKQTAHTVSIRPDTYKLLKKIKNVTGQKYDNIISEGVAILSARRRAEQNRRAE